MDGLPRRAPDALASGHRSLGIRIILDVGQCLFGLHTLLSPAVTHRPVRRGIYSRTCRRTQRDRSHSSSPGCDCHGGRLVGWVFGAMASSARRLVSSSTRA